MDDGLAISPAASHVPATAGAGRGWSMAKKGEDMLLTLSGDWIARDGVDTGAAQGVVEAAGGRAVVFDAEQLGRWDSGLLVFLGALRRRAREAGVVLREEGLPEAASRLLALTREASPASPPSVSPSLVARVGRSVIAMGGEAMAVLDLVGDTVLRGGAAVRGRVRMRGSDLLRCFSEAGVEALPIVTVVNVLVGGILAFVGAVQLRKFGADIYIAALIGLAVVREMAALMTAIVMSGRTGGAYAAHIATMQGSEEIDALRAIGIPVYDYLILPRVIALTCMMPVLYLYGSALGILGGFAVSVLMLNLSAATFVDQLREAVSGGQVVFGLAKSLTFGALIAIAGCRCGLRAGRSAADVGRAATTAVVVGIVGVIALDAVFAVCANALDF